MRWRQRYGYARPARPKARALKADEAEKISNRLKTAIDHSPVLRALGVQAHSLRSRFYLEWRWNPNGPDEESSFGRITPLQQPPGRLLLETPYGHNRWSQVGTGSPEKLIELVAGDTKGTFHGLGALDNRCGMRLRPVGATARGATWAECIRLCRHREVLLR